MDKAKAYFLLQRLERIIQIEHELPNRFRLQHLNRLKKKFKSSSDSEKLTTSDLTVNIDGLRGGVSDLKEKIFTIKDNMVSISHQHHVSIKFSCLIFFLGRIYKENS